MTRSAAGSARSAYRSAADSTRNAWWSASKQQRQTVRLTASSTVLGLLVSAGAVAAAGPWDSGQRTAERARAVAPGDTRGEHHVPGGTAPAPSAPPVLAAIGVPPRAGSNGPPSAKGVAGVLAPLMKDDAFGSLRTASVVDAATGRELFGAEPGRNATPASTVKLAIATAALTALGPEHRIDTTVVEGARGGLVLVGGGDPTLTARAPEHGVQDQPASLRTLADDTARALKERGTGKVRLGYDLSAYTGPVLHPISPNENITPVTSLMADEGRLDETRAGPAPRDTDPAATAARTFAQLLKDRGITVEGTPARTTAPAKARRLATTSSPPLAGLVERMLTNSDNDIGEALARQTALATGEPASFEGADRAVRKTLSKLNLPLTGAVFADGSGLDRTDRASAGLLSRLLALATSAEHPELRSVATGLPIAGFTGTLRGRYASEQAGAGTVRAKTGTLTGVNTLAGTVLDTDGRLLVFAFMTNHTTDAQAAQQALDKMASALANCGCR
ncbi:D-alanyl-D-alanine carboxypeptidase/D-alanyl-D-alanine endopeptidase [Streptomyces sp. CB02923]|uniref:D-alanyl-D-alanine carboxypeptidase/D-alanyl-D-alanine endopeptidase n=1 Tax=Streptomyces sp. CB02923 TaxID=1718985 RepID=UPI000A91D8D2|nr:D-alanyl-D-alanine carboxypeptidase/D-alanyl-D-alanine-endopeptidase [Streptomyces sp. CB02923]